MSAIDATVRALSSRINAELHLSGLSSGAGAAGIALACLAVTLVCLPACSPSRATDVGPDHWKIGRPIVTYWAGPGYPGQPLTVAAARQMSQGNWNVVWCSEEELDTVGRHGMRAQLIDGLLSPKSLDDPAKRAKLDALIERVRNHPALYSYLVTDEPGASAFPALGRLVAYLRQRDPAHLAYINLFPTYANNKQLGTQGDTVTAYRKHLQQFVEVVKPDLISYDHYHFKTSGDGDQYFLNLGMIRQTALDAQVPFLNIVQASTWTPSRRTPTGEELRWLAYTSLAYGAQGLSYYVYSHPPDYKPGWGQMTDPQGKPTALYHAAKDINQEFAAIAAQLQPLHSLGAYHVGMIPPGAEALSADAPFRFDPPVPKMQYTPPQPLKGLLLGCFGPADEPTHVVAVSLDYKQSVSTTVIGPGPLEVFHPASGTWRPAGGSRATLHLPPGGGRLLRLRP